MKWMVLFMQALPLPPFEMRQLVGPTDPNEFDNPNGALVYPPIPAEKQMSFFDFGCGCGRIARKLIQQNPRPTRYVGIDLHKGMVNWCNTQLKPHAKGFDFIHHNVFNKGFNPQGKSEKSALPVGNRSFQMVWAWSVFTHILEENVSFYLKEVSRILEDDGIFVSTWFTFDKRFFPMMQSFQNALYINTIDPSNAVIFDQNWLRTTAREAGLQIVHIVPPEIQGYQWVLHMKHIDSSNLDVDFPPDKALIGLLPPPVIQGDPSKIGTRFP